MMISFCSSLLFTSFIRRAYFKVACIALFSLLTTVHVQATTVLLLGDSLSAGYGMQASKGWASLVQTQMVNTHPDFKLLNFSASGETTGGGKARLARLLEKNKVDVLWIELGGNDGLRGYPLRTIRQNLTEMINMAKEKNIKVVLTKIQIPPNLGKRYTTKFMNIFTELAEKEEIELMPFFIESVALMPKMMQKDQIHPNEDAQPIIAKVVMNYWLEYLKL